MIINERLKTNKFVDVNIPSPRAYFQRLGAGSIDLVEYSGDEMIKQGNKVDNLALMEDYDKLKQKEEIDNE